MAEEKKLPGIFIPLGPERFCLVWGEDTQQVTVKQEYNAAMREAHRLSRKHKGQRFYVMSSVFVFLDGEPLRGPTPIGVRRLTLDTHMTLKEIEELPEEVINELSRTGQALVRRFAGRVVLDPGCNGSVQVSQNDNQTETARLAEEGPSVDSCPKERE